MPGYMEFLQDAGVVHSRIDLVAGGIGVLDVPEEQVGDFAEGGQVVSRELTAGLHAGGDPRLAAGGQQGYDPLGVGHGLAPRHGDAAMLPVKGSVPQDGGQDLGHGHVPRGGGDGIGAADGGATAAGGTPGAVKDPLGVDALGTRGAGRHAGAAKDALGLVEEHFGGGPLGLGVVAPGTTQRTALEEHHGPHPGAVVHTESLDRGYGQRHGQIHHVHPSFCPITISCHSLHRVTKRAFQPETRTDRV